MDINQKNIFKMIRQTVDYIALPIVNEFSFFMLMLVIQIFPVILYSYFNYSNIFVVYSVHYHLRIHSLPYILYIPFLFTYCTCILLCAIEKKAKSIYYVIKLSIFLSILLIALINSFLLNTYYS